MRTATAFFLALGSLAGLASMQGCGSSSGGNAPPEGDAATGSSSGSSSSSGGGSGGSSSGGGSGSSSGSVSTPYVGSIAVDMSSTMGGAGQPLRTLSAEFYATPDGGDVAAGCSGTQSGSCCYVPAPDGGGALPPGPTEFSAGTITVKDGSSTIATMMPGTANTYTAPPNATWMGGDTLSFTATGATIDAFLATVQVPAFPAGLQPALSDTTMLMVPQSSDFTLTWTGGMADAVNDLFITAVGGGSIRCYDVPDTTGSITVASTLLANMTKGATLIITLYRFVITTANAANATVTIGAGAELVGRGTLQ